ncbi:ArnT family glycosyltransferase [Patescibacteria group bacterium]
MERKSNISKNKLILLGVVLLAAVIRTYKVDSFPPSLYWEEAALGYDSYSIVKTGKDYHGNTLPIVSFPSFGDHKPSLYFYVAAPFIWTLGLNELAIRLPSVIAGIVAVYFIYKLARIQKLKEGTAILASFLLAISPWHIQLSRAAFEVNLAATLLLVGMYFLIKAQRKPNQIYVSSIILSLSMYAYHGLRIIAPLLAIATYLLYRKKYKFNKIIPALIVSLVLISPILINIKNPTVNQRLKETSYFTQSKAVEITNEYREKYNNSFLSRVIFHRYWFWSGELIENYFKNFTPNFLFIQGDKNTRHQTGEFGLLYHWEIISLFAAVIFLQKRRNKNMSLFIVWILVAPIPSMLTKTNPHTLRLFPGVFAFTILSAYGAEYLRNIINKKKLLKLIAFFIIFTEFYAFTHYYFKHYPTNTSQDWQYGYKQVVEYTEENKEKYDKIYFTRDFGRPSIYVLFYGKYDPKNIQSIEPTLKKDQQELLEFDKYVFGNPPPQATNALIVIPATDVGGQELNTLKQVDFLDKKPGFVI